MSVKGDLANAVNNGDLAEVERLLAQGADINERDMRGYTPLILAVKEGHVEIVQVLINKGATLNEKTLSGYTALMWAAISNGERVEIIRLLAEAGADLEEKLSHDGRTALDQAPPFSQNRDALIAAPELQRKIAEKKEKEKKEKKEKNLYAATHLTRNLPHKKSPFKAKRRAP